jgi:hypothetical protein
VKFRTDTFPIALISLVSDAFAAGDDRLAYIDCLGQREDLSTEFLDSLGILGLDSDKSLGDDITKKEGCAGAILRGTRLAVTELPFPIRVTQFVEHRKDFAGYRHDHLVDGSSGKV